MIQDLKTRIDLAHAWLVDSTLYGEEYVSETMDIIRSLEAKVKELEGDAGERYLIFKSKDEQDKFYNQGYIKGYEDGSKYALEQIKSQEERLNEK
jgi:flagellar biosynthesis/type III secretory pathway protein FliH